ncbi:MAG: hypothetical protein HC836_32965 [Richelia sp. RM2_1_2]|nr:hypothetical protein [Richelia sp. RM2_1_2]
MVQKEFVELLKGCRPIKDANGNIVVQSILNMQLVCLTTDKEFSLDDRFGNPFKDVVASNRGYGNLIFKNNSKKEVILPTQIAVITKQSAQNHGMVKSGYVSKNSTVEYNDAGCVQGSQTGYISTTGDGDYRLIPVSMREMLFDKVGDTAGHANIYPAIEKLGRDTKSDTSNYLDRYFTKYDKKLQEFIAHFERPKNLIGTIVLIDGEIVAIDKFPSFTYGEQVWNRLIRDCYGALAIMSEINNKTNAKLFTEEFAKVKTGETILDRLSIALNKTKTTITKSVEDKVKELLELSFDATLDTTGNPNTSGAPKSFVLKHQGYVGQVISEENYHHMVSLVKRERFDPQALRKVSVLKNKARKQDNFTM